MSAEGPAQRRLAHLRATLDALGRTLALRRERPLNEAERAGLIQFYALSWDQSWKVWRDLLTAAGVVLTIVAPAEIIRAAFSTGMIADPDQWTRAGRLRNELVHIYDDAAVERAAEAIERDYYPLLRRWVDGI